LTEQTEQKIEQLNKELAATRQERDESNTQAKEWAEKRNKIYDQIKALQTEVKHLKEQRDEINLQVQVLKTAREKAKAERNEKHQKLTQIREKIKALEPKKPSTRLKDLEKAIQSIEWKIQTSSLSVKEEKALVDQVRVLEVQRVAHKQLQELTDKMVDMQTEAKALGTQAKLNHEKLSQLAKESQGFHEKLIGVLNNIKSLRQNADEAHQKYVEIHQKADEGHERYVGIQRQIRALKDELAKKEKEHYGARGRALREEATKKAQEKLKRGEKLTWDEFKLLTEQEEATEH
jgi:uncharacterized coiled-coil DUF342 family protein